MERIINVNYEELFKASKNFDDQSKAIQDIKKNLLEIIDTIDNGWQGIDAENYKINFKKYIKRIYKESNYLEKWSDFLLKSSIKYDRNVQEGKQNTFSINKLDDKDNA